MNTKNNSLFALLTAGLLIANGANAQWSRNAGTGQTFLTTSTDFVGIGTSNPLFKLDVQQAGIATMQFKSTNNNASILLDRGSAASTSSLTYRSQGSNLWQTGIISNDNYNIRNNVLAAPAITCLSANNNVGIGVPNPTQKLHVSGNILATGNISAVNYVGSGNIDVSGYVGFGSVEQLTDGGANTIASNSSLVPTTDCSRNLGTSALRWNNIFACGDVHVGTTTSVAAQLSVANTTLSGVSGTGSFQIGETNSFNLVMDNNEIQSRVNGAVNTLFLQFNGGNLDANFGGGNALFHGNVAIKTSAPTSNFHLVHDQFVTGPELGGLTIENTFNSAQWKLYSSQSTSQLALYFNDNLRGNFDDVSGVYTAVSDERLKSNIKPLTGMMDKIMQLNPCSYEFKHNPVKGELYFGLIAQQLQKVLPEIVTVNKDDSGRNGEDLLTVSYSELIPVLIKGMQEQNEQIKMQNEKIVALEQALSQCCMSYTEKTIGGVITDGARLEQNAPNPFSENTIVKFYIPQNFRSAMVKIYSMNGEEMKSFNIGSYGLGQVEISGNSMSSGVYQYTLLIDGKAVDSKQMILTK